MMEKENYDSPFYSVDELKNLGATHVGRDVKISRLARFYGFKGRIGDFSRIDDFAIIKGAVDIGAHVHISSYCLVSGVGGTVAMNDFSGLSAHCAVYTASDDYSAPFLSNPTVPPEHTKSHKGDVVLGIGALVGAHCIILPRTTIADYATIGALCVIKGMVAVGDVVRSTAETRIVKKRDVAAIEMHVDAVRKKDKAL